MKITPIDFSLTDSSPKRFSQQRVRGRKVPRTDNSPNRHFPNGQFPEWYFPERAVPRRTFPQTYISFQEYKGDWYELLVLNKWSLHLCYDNWKYHEKKFTHFPSLTQNYQYFYISSNIFNTFSLVYISGNWKTNTFIWFYIL